VPTDVPHVAPRLDGVAPSYFEISSYLRSCMAFLVGPVFEWTDWRTDMGSDEDGRPNCIDESIRACACTG
jgi:hypothetical protein